MWATGIYNGDPSGTVADTSHCKSPADSREPHSVPFAHVTQFAQEAAQSLYAAPLRASRLPAHRSLL